MRLCAGFEIQWPTIIHAAAYVLRRMRHGCWTATGSELVDLHEELGTGGDVEQQECLLT